MPEYLALPPAIPAATRQQQRELAERETRQRLGEHVERLRQLRGLLVLALLVVAFSIARAGVDRVFPHDWWRVW
jgi:hypothetical protein